MVYYFLVLCRAYRLGFFFLILITVGIIIGNTGASAPPGDDREAGVPPPTYTSKTGIEGLTIRAIPQRRAQGPSTVHSYTR